MFCLQRTDILPVGDLGIQKGIRDMFSLKEFEPKNFGKICCKVETKSQYCMLVHLEESKN